ncbi:MAG: bromoperoxidase, partial [Cyanobacteria bacterium P01_G01_bin.38]
MRDRRLAALNIRREAAEVAANREHPPHVNNGEELRYRVEGEPSHIANFTKGLPHDDKGLLSNPDDYQQFVRAIDSGDVRD